MARFLILIFFSFILSAEYLEEESLLGTLYMQSSAEYKANTTSIYRAAMSSLPDLIADESHSAALVQKTDYSGKPPAVILDVDQTVLNNIAYQARMIKKQSAYPDGWISWAKEEKADYIEGAEEYLRYAISLGLEIFFVTNRVVEIEAATKNNLEHLGFIFSENIDQLLMRYEEEGWDQNKTSRIQRIAENYRIVMIIGDNLGDFVGAEENNLSVTERNDIFRKYDSHWGNFWFMLPNPVYGDWEGALIDFNYNLSQQDELSKKLQSLDEK